MVAFDIYDFQKQVTGNIELDDSVFAASINETFLHQILVNYQANKRQGTAKTLSRTEVSGTRTKPFRQKGTGRARQGTWHAPHHRGGATQFGPAPRSYRKAVPKKMKQEAFRQCLSMKNEQGQCFILGALDFPEVKTKTAAGMITNFAADKQVLILDVDPQPNAFLSIRNIKNASVLPVNSCSPLDIFESDSLILTQTAAELLEKRYSKLRGADDEEK
ncbi:MAG: 50S ribosomal protein L4 [Candidatus Hinthialibacter sp.]